MDWGYIFSISPEDLKDDEKDQLFNTITWYEYEVENPNFEQFKTIFKISQELLKYKGEQVETLIHELDEIAIKQGEEEARKIESDSDARSARSRKSSAIEIENLEQQYNELKTKFKKQQRIHEKQQQEMNKLKNAVKNLEFEKNQLEQELTSTKRDGSVSSELSDTIKDQHRELVETVHSKNKQISDLLHDIEDVEKENLVLKEKIAELKSGLAVATSEIENQTERFTLLDVNFQEAQETIRKLTLDNSLIQEDIQEITTKKTEIENKLVETSEEFNKRMKEWQLVFEEKEAELKFLREKLADLNVDSPSRSESLAEEQSHLSALQKMVLQRDSQLLELQTKLQEAVEEMEASAEMMESLKREKEEENKKNSELETLRKELKKQLKLAHERGQKLQEEVEYAEKVAEDKQEELEQIVGHLKEGGRLDEGQIVEDIQELRAVNRLNEKQIANLVKNINKLQDISDQMSKENSYLREKLGITEDDLLTLPNYQTKQKQHKKELLRLKRKLLNFEEENINLRTEVKNLNKNNVLLQDQLADVSVKSPSDSKSIENLRKIVTQKTLDEVDKFVEAESSLSIGEVLPIEKYEKKEKKLFEEEIKNLCEENEALRKGMHEILNSVNAKKESSLKEINSETFEKLNRLNAKKESSLKEIKSETFEKLLRALDVKHISGWYHPAMRLQAEVHNVEGINKELREQLRTSKIELEELRYERQELLTRRSTVSSPRHLVHSSTMKDIKTLDDLNESVNFLLERASVDAEICQEIAVKMEQFNKNFTAVEKQLEDLYRQTEDEKCKFDKIIENLKTKNKDFQCQIEVLEAKLKILNDDTSIDETVKNLAKLSGENLKSNLKREFLEVQCKNLEDLINDLRKENLKIENEHIKKTFEWSRNDKSLRSKLKILEKNLEQCVSLEENQKLKKDFENLTLKFRQLNEEFKRQEENTQIEIDLIKRSKQLSDDEKLEFKTKLTECMSKLNLWQNPEPADEKLQQLSRQLSESEINVLGERQRANHINNLYELVKDQLTKSEERFREYELHTKDVMHKNLLLQGQLKELEDKLCHYVDTETYNSLVEDQKKMLKHRDDLSIQLGKLQEEIQIRNAEEKTKSVWSNKKEEELLALKHQMVDLLASSDDKALIARYGTDLARARDKETEWRNKCEILSAQLEQCQEEWLDCLKQMDEEKVKSENREKQLSTKIRILLDLLENQKAQYHGCIPLISEQKFIENLKLTLENNHASFISLNNAQNFENESIILKEQLEIEKKNYRDRLKVLDEDNEEIKKVLNWLQEKNQVELDLIRLRRQAEFEEIQLKQSNERIQIQNDQIAKLEEELFLSYKNPDVQTLSDIFPSSSKLTQKLEFSPEKPLKFTKSQDVQTEEFPTTTTGKNEDSKRYESLKLELLNTKNEIETKEETIQQLKIKLNECEMNVSLFRKQIGDKQAQITFYEKHILELQQVKKDEKIEENLTSGENNEEIVGLKATVKALQDSMLLKEESILHYQSLLKEDRDNHSLAAARMQEEVKMLKISLADEKQKRMEYEDPTSEHSRSKAAIEQYVKQVHVLEQHTDELHTQVTTLESQLQASRQEGVRWRSLANDRLNGIDELRQTLEDQHKKELNVYKKDSEKWREEVLNLKDLINKHKNEILQVQPDLQNILKVRDDKIHELTTIIHEMQEKYQEHAENAVYSRTSEFEKAHEKLQKDNEIMKKRYENLAQKEKKAREEIKELKGQILKNKKPAFSPKTEKTEKSIKEQLQKKITLLEEEIARLKDELSAQSTVNEAHRLKNAEEFDKWKKQKQSQQIIEKLKLKLKEKDADVEKFQQTCSGYRSLIERLEREKHSLENRIKALKTNVNVYSMGNTQQTEYLTAENNRLTVEIEELKAKLEMQQRHAGGLGAAMMQEKLEAQERKLAILELSGKGTAEIKGELERQQSTISNLQKSNLFLEAKNIELKMDLEKSQKDIPRFREQIQHLENYIQVLKEEKKSQVPTTSVQSHNPDSRRVNELERTVLVLKRVVEKLQTENKRLMVGKRAPVERAGSAEKLRRDFNRLKERYSESVQKISELESVLNATSLKLKKCEEKSNFPQNFESLLTELKAVKEELDQKTQLLDKVKLLLHRAAVKEKALIQEIESLKMKLGDFRPTMVQASTSHV